MERPATSDGRNVRREQNRLAVIEAAFELVQEGKVPPSVETVAERAGVSVSSIFRNFDGLADMQRQAIELGHERFVARAGLEAEDVDGAREIRIQSFVRKRVGLYEEAGALMRLSRSRAVDFEPSAEGLANLRARLARQARSCFAIEVSQLTPVAAADFVAVVDTMTSPEAFELMTASHIRTPRQISRSWVATLSAVLEASNPTSTPGGTHE